MVLKKYDTHVSFFYQDLQITLFFSIAINSQIYLLTLQTVTIWPRQALS